MSINITASAANGGALTVTPTASGAVVDVGSVASGNVTLSVSGGIGPPGLGNLMLAEGNGINIATASNVATISTTLPIPANLADLADVATSAPSTGQVLTYNGTAWTAAADSTNLTGYATEAFVTSAVANLVDSSPAALDTLAELAQAIGDDANFSTTITNSLAGKANLSHTHNASDISGLANVATSGNYSDLAGIPSEFTAAAHNHTSAAITDFATAASANAPIQTVNNATGDIVIANGTGLTLTANGSTLTLTAAIPPSNLSDLADVSGSPSANQALIYNGSEWQPGNIPAGTTLNGLSGSVVLANGTGITLDETGQTLTLSAVVDSSNVDGGTFGAAGNVLTEGGDSLAAESGDTLTVEAAAAVSGDSIQLLRSSVAGATPGSLLAGELAINTEDGLLYWQRANGTIASADIDLTLANVAISGSYNDLSDLPALGTAAATNATDYATAAQGTLADSALQPGDLATVATSGNYSDLLGIPSEFTPSSHTHDIADVTGLQSELDAKAATVNLATVATSGNYSDLSGLPTLGTAAATDSTDYATAAQGNLADSAVQPADLATVAASGNYSDILGIPSEFTPAAHTHDIADVTGLQSALEDKAATANLASVATSGQYSDLSGLPTLGTAAATNSTDYATAAQGSLAESAVQPGDLAAVATSGSYSDLNGTPSNFTPTVHASTHATGGSDAIAPADIGAAPAASPTFTGVVTVPAGSAAAPAIVASGDSNTGIAFDTDTLIFSTDGNERVRVDSAGRLIAGDPSIGSGALSTADDIVLGNTDGQTGMTIRSASSGAGTIAFADAGSGNGRFAGYIQYAHAIDALVIATSSTERMRVKSTGAVRFTPLAADPASGEAGDVYYNSTTNKLRVYNGTSWVDLH